MKSEPASRCLDCGHSGHLIDDVCRRAVLFGNQSGICGHRCVLSVSAVSNEPPEKLWIAPVMLRHRSTTAAVYIYDETSKQERDIEYVRADKSDFRAGVSACVREVKAIRGRVETSPYEGTRIQLAQIDAITEARESLTDSSPVAATQEVKASES